MRTKIIGHRGAAGLALENTLISIEAAREIGVDGIEIDLRLTKDHQVVVFHDAHMGRLSQDVRPLDEIDFEELRTIPLNDGQTIPTLSEAIEAAGECQLIIEVKDDGMAQRVADILNRYPKSRIVVSSFKYHELRELKKIRPTTKIFPCANTNPFEGFYIARALGSTGITLNFWVLNPLTYLLSRWSKVTIMAYTINNSFFANLIAKLYPGIEICTDHPEKFTKSKSVTP